MGENEFDSTESIEGMGYDEPAEHDTTTRVVIFATAAAIALSLLCTLSACAIIGWLVLNAIF
jgi:hypothetical protein